MEPTCPDDEAGAPPRRKVDPGRPEGGPAPPDGSGLVRALGPIDATMIVIGSMIGSGIFITSAESSRLSGAPGWLLLAWAIAGLLTITGALCCSELATMMPRAGGVYVFLREAYGKSVGFLYGWTLFLVIQTGTIAAVAIAFAVPLRFLSFRTSLPVWQFHSLTSDPLATASRLPSGEKLETPSRSPSNLNRSSPVWASTNFIRVVRGNTK